VPPNKYGGRTLKPKENKGAKHDSRRQFRGHSNVRTSRGYLSRLQGGRVCRRNDTTTKEGQAMKQHKWEKKKSKSVYCWTKEKGWVLKSNTEDRWTIKVQQEKGKQ
jgi:hypothetical protein